VIYTPQEIISRRDARKGQKPRPAGENAARSDLSICVKIGPKRAPIGHKYAVFWRRRGMARTREMLVFSENVAVERRFERAIRAVI
jgi:hypothetical protein